MSYYINALTGRYHGYIHYEPIYDLKMKYENLKQTRNKFICCNFNESIENLLNDYIVFQDKRKHENKRCVYGTQITIMLDDKRSEYVLKKIVLQFMQQLLQFEKLPYIAYHVMLGQGHYIRLIVLDRQLVPRHYLRHHRSLYMNEKGCFVAGPGKGHKLIVKKGDYKLDKDGHRILSDRFAMSKSRLFKANFIYLKNQMIKAFEIAIAIDQRDEQSKGALFFKKEQFKPFFNKRVLAGIRCRNQLKITMEKHINSVIVREITIYPVNDMAFKRGNIVFSQLAIELRQLYYRYREKIKKIRAIAFTQSVIQMQKECKQLEESFLIDFKNLLADSGQCCPLFT